MATSSIYYPPPCFRFTVSVGGGGAAQASADAAFLDVSGLEGRIEVESFHEGGENRYQHQLPKLSRFENLVLRRGYVTGSSYLADWAARTVGSTFATGIETNTMVVSLLGADQSVLVSWNIDRAWPVRWVAGPLDAQKNEVMTEVMEFSYATATRLMGQGSGR